MSGIKSLKKQRRIQLIWVAFALSILTTALVGYAFQDGINYFRTPAEVAKSPPPEGQVFRIGGLVEVGSLKRGESEVVTFNVTDTVVSIPARFQGILPDLFLEGAGMVGTGVMEGDTFVASEILARHDESYMPKEAIDALKAQGVYVEPAKE